MLNRGAHRVLDRSPVEPADRLKFVERDHDLPAVRVGQAGRQAKTSSARREMSRSVRAVGKDTVSPPRGDESGAYRTSALADRTTSRSQVRARLPCVSAATRARAHPSRNATDELKLLTVTSTASAPRRTSGGQRAADERRLSVTAAAK